MGTAVALTTWALAVSGLTNKRSAISRVREVPDVVK